MTTNHLWKCSTEWKENKEKPTLKGIYEIEVKGMGVDLAYWDGDYFSRFGVAVLTATSRVNRWRGPIEPVKNLVKVKPDRIPASDRVMLATRTEAPINSEVLARFQNIESLRLLHSIMGVCTEGAGEMMDIMKKHFFYGKPIDKVHVGEEMGDVDWYLNLCCDVLKTTMAIIEKANVEKLAKRYGEKFSEDAALLRDLGAELQVLQDNLGEDK